MERENRDLVRAKDILQTKVYLTIIYSVFNNSLYYDNRLLVLLIVEKFKMNSHKLNNNLKLVIK